MNTTEDQTVRSAISDMAFSIEGVSSLYIELLPDGKCSVRTNLNKSIPIVLDTNLTNDEIYAELNSKLHGQQGPKPTKPAYTTRQAHIALLSDASLDVICGWTRTTLPSGRLVLDRNDPTRTPMVIRRDKARYGGGVESLEDHPVIRSQEMIAAADLIEISTGASL